MSADFRLYLQRELLNRCKRNPRYSIRSFAAALKTDHSSLSQILRGTRKITSTMVVRLGKALGLGPHEIAPFLRALSPERQLLGGATGTGAVALEFRDLSLDTFIAISDWYHDAILELTRLRHFKPDPRWIAHVLGITVSEVRAASERLIRLGLLEIGKDGKWRDASGDNLAYPAGDFADVAFRKLQKQILGRSLEAIDAFPLSARDHGSMCMAIRASDLPAAKKRMRAFREDLCRFLQRPGGPPDRLYQLATSLFPLTSAPKNE